MLDENARCAARALEVLRRGHRARRPGESSADAQFRMFAPRDPGAAAPPPPAAHRDIEAPGRFPAAFRPCALTPPATRAAPPKLLPRSVLAMAKTIRSSQVPKDAKPLPPAAKKRSTVLLLEPSAIRLRALPQAEDGTPRCVLLEVTANIAEPTRATLGRGGESSPDPGALVCGARRAYARALAPAPASADRRADAVRPYPPLQDRGIHERPRRSAHEVRPRASHQVCTLRAGALRLQGDQQGAVGMRTWGASPSDGSRGEAQSELGTKTQFASRSTTPKRAKGLRPKRGFHRCAACLRVALHPALVASLASSIAPSLACHSRARSTLRSPSFLSRTRAQQRPLGLLPCACTHRRPSPFLVPVSTGFGRRLWPDVSVLGAHPQELRGVRLRSQTPRRLRSLAPRDHRPSRHPAGKGVARSQGPTDRSARAP